MSSRFFTPTEVDTAQLEVANMASDSCSVPLKAKKLMLLLHFVHGHDIVVPEHRRTDIAQLFARNSKGTKVV